MPPTPEELKRKKEIAEQLVQIETACPGSIRLRANPGAMPAALKILSQAGFKKPFLALSQQFVIDTFLSYPLACDLLLPYCFLVGPKDEQHRLHIWDGFGNYKSWCRILPPLQRDEPVMFIINIAPIFIFQISSTGIFCDLLEPNRTFEKEMLESLNKNRPPTI